MFNLLGPVVGCIVVEGARDIGGQLEGDWPLVISWVDGARALDWQLVLENRSASNHDLDGYTMTSYPFGHPKPQRQRDTQHECLPGI